MALNVSLCVNFEALVKSTYSMTVRLFDDIANIKRIAKCKWLMAAKLRLPVESFLEALVENSYSGRWR